MSDRMYPLSFASLMERALAEYVAVGEVFGVKTLYRAAPTLYHTIFDGHMETPVGPAAGPHSQLAQNLLAAYAAGARFFELKTVQILDGEDLPVSKPCIFAEDEAYNVEWSTELTVEQAQAEYVKAWFGIKLLCREWDLGAADGFIFNMSVGYDLAGVQSPKLDAFIEGLKDASALPVWQECRDWALANLRRFRKVDAAYIYGMDSHVCRSATVSTLHGCPPGEIEAIASYLLLKKGLHTYVKCNPTLLGYDFARETLDQLGFGYIHFDDRHFREDLQFADAVPLLERLLTLAESLGLQFGVKLSNTLPAAICRGELPGQEMYLSGRALYPLTVSLAAKLAGEFGERLPISYSGGAELYNIKQLLAAGLRPVTMATPLLKPGGYQRLTQIAEAACSAVHPVTGIEHPPVPPVDAQALQALRIAALQQKQYRKPVKPRQRRRIAGAPPLLDCFAAPCQQGCPIQQDIAAYVAAMAAGDAAGALTVITQRNPLPFITGTICPHPCMDNCNRCFLESGVDIREIKLQAAEQGYRQLLTDLWPAAANHGRIAVVGGGPAGMAVSFFLARAGYEVHIFEQAASLGGLVQRVIPDFRIGQGAIDKDISLLMAMGIVFHGQSRITDLAELRQQGFGQIVLAVGAGVESGLKLEQGQAQNALAVLEQYKKDAAALPLGAKVAVVGGGNSAMDVARAALRVPGVEQVCIVYRRDKAGMPADPEELQLAEEEGVRFHSKLAPVRHRDGILVCERMELSRVGGQGRPVPRPTGELVEIAADTVIAATGQRMDSAFYQSLGLPMGENGWPRLQEESGETGLPGVYLIGDGATGPATVVEAIASAAKTAAAISGARYDTFAELNGNAEGLAARGMVLPPAQGKKEAERCLGCAALCGLCAEVCPNRANVLIDTPLGKQIVHLDALCNECGNCAVFCPYQQAPYQHKFTVYRDLADFAAGTNPGMLYTADKQKLLKADDAQLAEAELLAETLIEKYKYLL